MTNKQIRNVNAYVFDAYGTLFDINSAAAHCKEELGQQWESLAETWRTKQLNYTWLRSLMDEWVDFSQVTKDALEFSLEMYGIIDENLKERLLGLYDKLDPYPEVPNILETLKKRGLRTAILSNGTERMLESAVESAGLRDWITHIISVDKVKIYKPHPSIYRLASNKLELEPEQICFMSSNAWDASGAANYGFQVFWINRFGQKTERLPGNFIAELTTLEDLPSYL